MSAPLKKSVHGFGIFAVAGVLLAFFLLLAQNLAIRVEASEWQVLSTARLIDDLTLQPDLADRVAAGDFFQSPAILGGEREVVIRLGGVGLVWDGPDADPGRLDPAGLGGMDLTGAGLHDHFVLNVGPNPRPVRYALTVYSELGERAVWEGWLSPSTDARELRLAFGDAARSQASVAALARVGALSLELTGVADPGWLRSIAAETSLQLTRRLTLVADQNGDGRPGDGDVVAYELRVNNPGNHPHPGFVHALDLPARAAMVVTGPGDGAGTEYLSLPGSPQQLLPELAPGQGARFQVKVRLQQVTLPAEVVLQVGDTPPGGGGSPVESLNLPFANGLGEVGFTGLLDDGVPPGEGFVWKGEQVVWRNGLSGSPVLAGAEIFMGIGDAGEFIYSPSADGNDAVWTQDGLLAARSDPAPGFTPGTSLTFNSRPTMLPDGSVHWVAGFDDSGTPPLTTQGRVLYGLGPAATDTVQVLLRSDDVIGGYTVTRSAGVGFDYWFSQDGSHHIQELVLDTGSPDDDNFVYLDGTLVHQEGSPTGSGDNWDIFGFAVVNEGGHYLLHGQTDAAPGQDAVLAYDGQIQLREGDTVAGAPLTPPANPLAVGLNNQGQAAYAWEVLDGADAFVFAACNAASLPNAHLLLATGDLVDLDGDLQGDAVVEGLNAIGPGLALTEDGFVFLEVVLDAGLGDREAILKLPLNCGESPAITLEKTVGLDPLVCAQEANLNVGPGSDVVYCYRVNNTGTLTLTTHDLADSELGVILADEPVLLPPGGWAFVTATTTILTTTVNEATWMASSGYLTATASASATVTVAPFPLYLPITPKLVDP